MLVTAYLPTFTKLIKNDPQAMLSYLKMTPQNQARSCENDPQQAGPLPLKGNKRQAPL